ncbi:hypothetical protein [Asticcacaulis solisilvae]|uniref:hypothetical protein n=1 Tax=Asticcacaulis solisilvae TaxID=1217274 RepID=UPI003FD862A2
MLKSAIVLSLIAAGLALSACSSMGMADQGATKTPTSQAPSNPTPSSPPAMPSSSGY